MNGAEAVLEEMGVAVVAPVESERVSPVQSLDCARELTIVRLQHEVVVVGHEAVAQAAEVGSLHDAIEAVEEVDSIAVKAEDRLPVAPP